MYQIHLGNLGVPQVAPSHDEFSGQLIQRPSTTVAPPPQSIPQVPTGTPEQTCRAMLADWKAQNPTLAACLSSADDAQLLEICMWGFFDPAKQAQAGQQVQNYVAQACARNQPPVVVVQPKAPPFTPPQATQPPPITPPPQQDFPGGPPSGGPGDVPGDTSTPPAKSFLRQVGPIVGIGLLAAVGLTYARKRALTKRKRRK
jgi:hypothetical protein